MTCSLLDTDEVLLEHGEAAGPGTHNEAEYRALLYALRQAEAWDAEELFVKSDSKLIVNQVNGEWAVRQDHLKGYAQEAMRLMALLPEILPLLDPAQAERDRRPAYARPPRGTRLTPASRRTKTGRRKAGFVAQVRESARELRESRHHARAISSGLQRSKGVLVLHGEVRRKGACRLGISLAGRPVGSRPERLGPVPQLVFKTSTAS
jgi:reverse transcriptase-like protein